MTDMQAVFHMVDEMTPEEKEQLLEYLEEQMSASQPAQQNQRIPGLFAGGWISDDFTEELPDEFWNFSGDYGYQGGRWKANSDSSQY